MLRRIYVDAGGATSGVPMAGNFTVGRRNRSRPPDIEILGVAESAVTDRRLSRQALRVVYDADTSEWRVQNITRLQMDLEVIIGSDQIDPATYPLVPGSGQYCGMRSEVTISIEDRPLYRVKFEVRSVATSGSDEDTEEMSDEDTEQP